MKQITNINRPLTGIRILDLSRLLPGPYATLLLGDLGAEVIKVETPLLGDYARRAPEAFGGMAMFELINRGKKSIGLNYRNKIGRKVFLRLASKADVILESFKPGSVSRWGIGFEEVQAVNPGIVYCSLSGYGQDGPYRDRVGHDLNYIALAGLLELTGEPGSAPTPPGVQLADLGGATMAAMAILAALLQKGRTGLGTYLDMAMFDTVVHWVMPTSAAILLGTQGEPERGRMPLTGGWACNAVYETADGRFITLAAIEPPFWSTFCQTIDRPDLLDKAFDAGARGAVREIFLDRTLTEWIHLFHGKEVPLEPVNTISEMLIDPQVRARGMVDEVDPRI